jgi:transposase
LDQIPADLRVTIKNFTTDMWKGYRNAIEEYVAAHDDVQARVVVDRFHVTQNYRDDFDELRKQELKRLKEELPEEVYDRDCKGTMWLLRHNHAQLDDEERGRLRRLLSHSPTLHQAYTFREELTAIFNQDQTVAEGEHRLKRWIEKVVESGLTCFDGFIKTLRNHWQPIVNYFAERVNSGFVEGLNNKIKIIKRRCYGIEKIKTLFQRLWLDLEGFDRFFPSTP